LGFSSAILHEIFSEHHSKPLPAWCRITSMEEYGQGKHDKVKDELSQLLRYNPSAWSRKQNKVILRLDDVHSARKLLKDIPDYLVESGSRGDAIIFDARELEDFLQSSVLSKDTLLRSLGRLLGRRT
jgi:hypothetical protein